MTEENSEAPKLAYREVAADLVETIPDNGGLLHWVLASPVLLFFAWVWVDLFAHFSPLASYWLDVVLGLIVYVAVIVLPLGVAAFWVVSSVPRLFGHAGWDVQPLEAVRESELHMVRWRYMSRRRANTNWGQAWTRAAQGWVYLEIAVILVGAIVMIPVFFSVSDFGFGK